MTKDREIDLNSSPGLKEVTDTTKLFFTQCQSFVSQNHTYNVYASYLFKKKI